MSVWKPTSHHLLITETCITKGFRGNKDLPLNSQKKPKTNSLKTSKTSKFYDFVRGINDQLRKKNCSIATLK